MISGIVGALLRVVFGVKSVVDSRLKKVEQRLARIEDEIAFLRAAPLRTGMRLLSEVLDAAEKVQASGGPIQEKARIAMGQFEQARTMADQPVPDDLGFIISVNAGTCSLILPNCAPLAIHEFSKAVDIVWSKLVICEARLKQATQSLDTSIKQDADLHYRIEEAKQNVRSKHRGRNPIREKLVFNRMLGEVVDMNEAEPEDLLYWNLIGEGATIVGHIESLRAKIGEFQQECEHLRLLHGHISTIIEQVACQGEQPA